MGFETSEVSRASERPNTPAELLAGSLVNLKDGESCPEALGMKVWVPLGHKVSE